MGVWIDIITLEIYLTTFMKDKHSLPYDIATPLLDTWEIWSIFLVKKNVEPKTGEKKVSVHQ